MIDLDQLTLGELIDIAVHPEYRQSTELMRMVVMSAHTLGRIEGFQESRHILNGSRPFPMEVKDGEEEE